MGSYRRIPEAGKLFLAAGLTRLLSIRLRQTRRARYPIVRLRNGNVAVPKALPLRVNQEIDFVRENIGNFADQVAAQDVDHGPAARRAED